MLRAQGPAPRPLAFTGVTVVDVTTGRRVPEQTVVVVGQRIQAVGPRRGTRLPPGTQVVEARGKYLIPGLWDMHAHVAPFGNKIDPIAAYRAFYPLFIANGVTGLREMDQRFSRGADSLRVWQREIRAGTRIGPRVIGPSFDVSHQTTDLWPHPHKEGRHPEAITLKTPDDARRIVDSLKAAGMVFLKYHESGGNRDLYFALLREARRAGLPVVGHVPTTVSGIEAADSGQRTIEHMNEFRPCWNPEEDTAFVLLWDSPRVSARCAPLAEAYIRNDTWLTPTLVWNKYMWGSTMPYEESATGNSRLLRALPYSQSVVRTLRHFGVTRFLAGSDFYFPPSMGYTDKFGPYPPGRSLLDELELLVGAGLTPLEALQAGTLNPAQFLNGTDTLGTVAPGKLADLVLLDADPLADIRNVRQIRAVVANGRYFDRAALDRIAAEAVARTRALPWRGWERKETLPFQKGWGWGAANSSAGLSRHIDSVLPATPGSQRVE